MSCEIQNIDFSRLEQESFKSPTIMFGQDVSQDAFTYQIRDYYSNLLLVSLTSEKGINKVENSIVLDEFTLPLGRYKHELKWTKDGFTRVVFQGIYYVSNTKKICPTEGVFTLKDESTTVNVSYSESVIQPVFGKGEKGDSAYLIALNEGFSGTEKEWLTSLKGDNGSTAYEVAKQNGFSGTEQEWLTSLKGSKGDNVKGDSAYQVATSEGYTGSKSQWLESLKGNTGDSAFKIAQNNGFTGTQNDWLTSLKGDKGADYTSSMFSGTDIPLGNVLGSYSTQKANNATSYNVVNKVLGGWAVLKINAVQEPTLEGTKLAGATFKQNTDMYLFTRYNGSNVDYFFSKLAETSLFDMTQRESSQETVVLENEYVARVMQYAKDKGFKLPTNLDKYKKLIEDLDKARILAKLDLMYLFSGNGDAGFKCINIITPSNYNATPFGGLDWKDVGVKGNGSNGYVDTNFNPTTGSFQYKQDNGCRGIFRTESNNGNGVIDGATPNFNSFSINPETGWARINSGHVFFNLFKTNDAGYFSLQRTDSNNVVGICNENKEVGATQSVYWTSATQKVMAQLSDYGSSTLGCYFMGASLTDTENTTMYNLLKIYFNL